MSLTHGPATYFTPAPINSTATATKISIGRHPEKRRLRRWSRGASASQAVGSLMRLLDVDPGLSGAPERHHLTGRVACCALRVESVLQDHDGRDLVDHGSALLSLALIAEHSLRRNRGETFVDQ